MFLSSRVVGLARPWGWLERGLSAAILAVLVLFLWLVSPSRLSRPKSPSPPRLRNQSQSHESAKCDKAGAVLDLRIDYDR